MAAYVGSFGSYSQALLASFWGIAKTILSVASFGTLV